MKRTDIRLSPKTTLKLNLMPHKLTPSLWSVGIVLSIVFCLMNGDVNAKPIGADKEVETKESSQKSKRSISDQILHQLELEWYRSQVKTALDSQNNPRNARDTDSVFSRTRRTTGDTILAQWDLEWTADQAAAGTVSGDASARAKRNIFTLYKEEKESGGRRSIADQKLADLLARQNMGRGPRVAFGLIDPEKIGKRDENKKSKVSESLVHRLLNDAAEKEVNHLVFDKLFEMENQN